MGFATLRPVIAVALATALAGCLVQDPVEPYGGPTMGSTYSVKYVRADGTPAPDELKRRTDAFLAQLDAEVSTYRGDSWVQGFNALPAGRCAAMPDSVREMIALGESLSMSSGGAFDLTLEPLLEVWGFGPHGKVDHLPSAEAIAAARQRTGHQHLQVRDGELCKDRDVALDFNAIAAGYAVDRVSALLEAAGVTSYLVEITGELKARGRKPDGEPWRIAIEAPRENERSAQRIVELDGHTISTSGDYRNYFEQDGKRYSHTLDPSTGAPIEHRLASVTVAADSALRADGLSTLLMVLGPERGLAYAERHAIAAFFIVRDDAGFNIESTGAFEALFGAGGTQ